MAPNVPAPKPVLFVVVDAGIGDLLSVEEEEEHGFEEGVHGEEDVDGEEPKQET